MVDSASDGNGSTHRLLCLVPDSALGGRYARWLCVWKIAIVACCTAPAEDLVAGRSRHSFVCRAEDVQCIRQSNRGRSKKQSRRMASANYVGNDRRLLS